MASVLSGNQIKLNNGQTVQGQQGAWYDGQQYWGGSLSNPGQINSNSNQIGAGGYVSPTVMNQTNPNNAAFVQQQQQKAGIQPVQNDTGNPAFGTPMLPSGGGTGAVPSVTTTPSLNLPDLYNSLEQSSGIRDIQQQLTKAQQDFNTESSKINDNPFLSEAERAGRQQKLQNDFNNDTKSIQDELAMKNADVQTQLNLATQQYNINSEASKAAMDQFNTLLSSGALDNASGNDIASLAQQTGMSTSMIQSAIKASAAKNQKTQVISFDDGTNQGFAVIDPTTGNIISKQVIAGSKPTKGSSATATAADNKQQALQQLPIDFQQNRMTLGTAMSFYQQFGLTPQQIYNQYKVSGVYNPTPAQVKADQKKYNVK